MPDPKLAALRNAKTLRCSLELDEPKVIALALPPFVMVHAAGNTARVDVVTFTRGDPHLSQL
jgi:hypothetical protein